MGSARAKGVLKKWFHEKGYGFITPDHGSKDIFIHISAFDRNIPRQPKTGDTIFYHVTTDKNGKFKAVDAAIKGAAALKHTKPSKPKQPYCIFQTIPATDSIPFRPPIPFHSGHRFHSIPVTKLESSDA